MYYTNIKNYEDLVGLCRNTDTTDRDCKNIYPAISVLGKGVFLALIFAAAWSCFA